MNRDPSCSTRGRDVVGRVIQLGPGPVTGVPALKVDTEDGAPRLMSVAFQIVAPAGTGEAFGGAGGVQTAFTGANRPRNNIYADLKWSANNALYQARADVRDGSVLNIFAAALEVFLSSENTSGAMSGTTETDSVSASLIYGGMISNVKPTRTVEVFNNAGPFFVINPAFAREVIVKRGGVALPNPAFALIFQDEIGNNIEEIPIAAGAEMMRFEQIPNRCTNLLISAAGGANWQVIYNLDL